MLGTKKKGSSQPKSTGNDILDALKEFDTGRAKRAEQEKKAHRFDFLKGTPGVIKIVALVAVIAVVGLVVDGVRREGHEFRTVLKSFSGQVTISSNGGADINATEDAELRDKDVIKTGPGATATLAFSDGSAVQLEENTEFEVRLLDYTRGGNRDRSFMLRSGSAVSQVSKFFGKDSRATVCTPTAVAAVRGTGFRVTFDPAKKETYLQVVDGTVEFKTPFVPQPVVINFGQMTRAEGYSIHNPEQVPEARFVMVDGVFKNLSTEYAKEPSKISQLEAGLNAFFDPALQVMGISPNGWGFSANNAARKAMCQEGLRQLQRHILVTFPEEVPEYFNPITYEELQIDPKNLPRLEQAFFNGMIESYQKTGKDTWIVRARARDRKRSLFQITEAGGVREINENAL